MEIHKPKPVHSWREFLSEIGVVVIGVCIALAAEQSVEWLHWHVQVGEAREVIATELTENLAGAINRVRQADCVERGLDQLAIILDGAAKSGSLPPVGNIGIPWRQTYPSGAWESVIASQTATHFPRQQLADIASLYKVIQRLAEFNSQELEPWNSLFTMVGPGRRLDPASEAKLRDALSQARSDSRGAAYLADQVIERAKAEHIAFSGDNLQRIAALQHDPATLDEGVCAPLGTPPQTYGQGYVWTPREKLMRARLANPPDFSEK
ncbi:MAG: hypothetical protein JO256_12065 [Alphaproteobacteria bacterium]|nr:hypothetical protein [Alphaproteobacteria bacterium]